MNVFLTVRAVKLLFYW